VKRGKPIVILVQRGVWAMEKESMPLAAAYLKAIAEADPVLSSELEIKILNFNGADTTLDIAKRILRERVDVLGFSVLGWNYLDFGRIAELYKSMAPDGWVVFGGNHVSDQATRVFGTFPAVDFIVNGEGELTFVDLLRSYVAHRSKYELTDVSGISFRDADGRIVTTAERERIVDLDVIPSPILTGTVSLLNPDGRPRYDVVLLETNRGCPYKCSFCYWGGATGQKLRKFSSDRVAAELDVIGRHKLPEVVLCDANFGMLEEDMLFLENLIRAREKHGYPRSFETSWAKNKNKTFYDIVRRMCGAGIKSSFTLALQSLSDTALEAMQRKNMKLNAWQDLAAWLETERLDCYAEIIWGLPGETAESFFKGYDDLARRVSRIAVYPLLIMPNTAFSDERKKYGLVLLRSDKNDFEYVMAHDTMTFDENVEMHKFIFWARVVAENQVLRHIWKPLRELSGLRQSQILLAMDGWFERQTDAVCRGVISCRAEVLDNLDASRITRGLQYFHLMHQLGGRIEQCFVEEILPLVDPELRDCALELLRYDLLTRPIYRPTGGVLVRRPDPPEDLPIERLNGIEYYVRRDVSLRYDFPRILPQLRRGERPDLTASPPPTEPMYYRVGYADHIDNHEFVSRYVGQRRHEIEYATRPRRTSMPPRRSR
jgi:radical SAM superfamily enzyme YgiQ (UPF0313 family)